MELKVVKTGVMQQYARRSCGGRSAYRQNQDMVYFSPASETVLENLFGGRYTRPYAELRKLLPEVLRQVGVEWDGKAVWSQKAGCTCPCSPGFLLLSHGGKHIFVEYETVDAIA